MSLWVSVCVFYFNCEEAKLRDITQKALKSCVGIYAVILIRHVLCMYVQVYMYVCVCVWCVYMP